MTTRRIEIGFIGGAYEGPSTNIDAQTCQNLYAIVDQNSGKSVLALRGTPGMKEWYDSGSVGECRGYLLWNDSLYVVIGASLIKMATDATGTTVGTLGTTEGRVWMAGGTVNLCLVDGSKGYYQTKTATSLTEITDVDFPVPTSLAYQDGYFIVTEKDSDTFYISASEDASSWGGLDWASAEDTPDDAIALVSHRREIHIIGEQTKEVFYNSGNSTFPFTRIPNSVIPIGFGAIESIAHGDEGLFWLDDGYRPRMGVGYDAVPIAPEQIEYQIQQYDEKSDAVGYVYSQEGHSFYVLTFPTAQKTWAFDITTGIWHTRAYGVPEIRHRAQWATWFAEKVIVGDYANGKLYEFDFSTYTDVGGVIRRRRTAQPTHSGRDLISFASFELEFESGVGLVTGQGNDPQAMLDWSDNGGHTWGNEHWADIGEIGNYKTRVIWRRLGKSRGRIFRVSITDPVKVIIIGAYLGGGV